MAAIKLNKFVMYARKKTRAGLPTLRCAAFRQPHTKALRGVKYLECAALSVRVMQCSFYWNMCRPK